MASRTTPVAAPDREGEGLVAGGGLSYPLAYPSAFVLGDSLALGFFIPAKKFKYRNGYEFDVPAKERPKARVIPGKRPFAQFYTPPKTREWEEYVGKVALEQLRGIEFDGPEDFTLPVRDKRIIAALRFNLRKPTSVPKYVKHAVKKPDLDNLAKAILDALVYSQVIEDDNCITDLTISKRYECEEHPMGVEVDLTCLPT